ncbi:retrovirus-related pol polyprotein from transposon TNT 1-94 [Tanacetum coccineum]
MRKLFMRIILENLLQKADDGYFLGYFIVSKGFSTRREQSKETVHVVFNESVKATTKTKGHPDLINTQGTNEQIVQAEQNDQGTNNLNVQTELIETPITDDHLGDKSKPLVHILKLQSLIWSGEQNIELLNIICKPTERMLTKSMAAKLIAVSTNKCIFADFLYEVKPKKVSEVLKHPRWVGSMQEELNQFHRNKVWTIIPCPRGKTIIGSKWIFMNKMDKYGTIIGKKERVVAQGYMQEKGIEYDETFALVARLKAIRIFIAYATYMNFKVYQMDFKSAFLNGKLKKEVFVQQPSSFESSEFLEYIYKLDKALYGLKQALRAWFETLFNFLIQKKIVKGKIDLTFLSTKDVIFVQVYVDEIIFGSTNYKLCKKV